jgi:thioredoxin-like negative regulator of GroEL
MKQVIRFTAAWCGPCKTYAPTFEKVASEVSGVQFKTIDVDSGDPLIMELGIRNVPTTVVLEGSQVLQRQSGTMGVEQLRQLIG